MAITKASLISDKETQLAEVRAAISAVLKNQSYALDDGQGKQSVTKANLKDLREMEKELTAEIIRLQSGGSKSYAARPV